jgi:hypothetical protein
MDWLFEEGVRPIAESLIPATYNGEVQSLIWFLQHGMGPTAIFGGHLDALIWILQQGVQPTLNDVNLSASSGQVQILDFFNRQYRQLPVLTQEEIATLGRVDVLIRELSI